MDRERIVGADAIVELVLDSADAGEVVDRLVTKFPDALDAIYALVVTEMYRRHVDPEPDEAVVAAYDLWLDERGDIATWDAPRVDLIDAVRLSKSPDRSGDWNQ